MSGPADLVFEGGGVKGIGLAGAYCELARRDWTPQRVAGTSAGAITAAFVAARYPPDKLTELVLHRMEFPRFADGAALMQAPRFLRKMGLHPGDYFEDWMRERLAEQHVHTFGDLLADPETDDLASRYRLEVIASDVTLRRMLILPRDAREHLGIDDPDTLEVAKAVRMSMSIPLFFEPVEFKNPTSGNTHRIVDGGLLSNFPVWLFDCPPGQKPRWPTFGMLLVAPTEQHPLVLGEETEAAEDEHEHFALVQYLRAIGRTALEAHDRLYVERASFARTIPIDTTGVGTTEFAITDTRKQALFDSGGKAAADFLDSWDFGAYIKTFREREDTTTRRQAVLDHMRRASGSAASST
jgi:NTE family protein